MRCKTCDYPLWNIKARQCPECGAVFVPSEFDFVINSVQFCCPHCEQEYYGTGVRGHLVPDQFHCVSCGQRVHMNQMLLRPAGGVTEDQTQIDRMPWIERQQRGFIKGWFSTVIKSMIDPSSLMRGVPLDHRIGDAWIYAIITLLIILTTGAGIPLLGLGAIMSLNGNSDWIEPVIGSPIAVIGGTVGILILVAIWGACTHAVLRLTGGCEYSIGRTYQSILYGTGTLSPIAVPCIGPYCGTWILWIWWSICATLMVAQGQRVHGGRATLAVLSFPCLVVFLIVVGYVVLVMGAIYGAFGASRQFQVSAISEVNTLTSAIVQYANGNGGNAPAHALQLVSAAQLGTPNFCSMYTATDSSRINMANTTLDQIDYLPSNKQAAAIQSVAGALPSDVVAHRLGDFVFTYHGINLNQCDPNLWIVVFSPDPDFNAGLGGTLGNYAGLASGTSQRLVGDFANDLADQNRLRATYNLPTLPDPATVTHDKPARAN